jgi:predicted nuclease of predicted toxin-antitoxin system
MRFLADIGISPKAVAYLRSQDYDAIHLSEENLHSLPDPDILSKAQVEKRILLTHDLDFGELLAASGFHIPSVVIFRLSSMTATNVNLYLAAVLQEHSLALQQGAIISVTDTRIRIRTLPIKRNGSSR